MPVSPEAIKELRKLTGAGILLCRQALQASDGDIAKAMEWLKKKGVAIAAGKAERATAQGLVHAYVHHDSRYGALVELNCETDFVARTDEFRQLAQDVAMQVAAMNPSFLGPGELPAGSDNPRDLCLLLQPFIKDEKLTIQDLITEAISKTGENIRVRRFTRFELGR